eukprot:SAG25_NODE_481_length_7507_cov_80.752160_6_plen_144_part_00
MILHSGLKKNNASVAEKALPAQVFGNEIVNVRTGSGSLHQPASPEQSRGAQGLWLGRRRLWTMLSMSKPSAARFAEAPADEKDDCAEGSKARSAKLSKFRTLSRRPSNLLLLLQGLTRGRSRCVKEARIRREVGTDARTVRRT